MIKIFVLFLLVLSMNTNGNIRSESMCYPINTVVLIRTVSMLGIVVQSYRARDYTCVYMLYREDKTIVLVKHVNLVRMILER